MDDEGVPTRTSVDQEECEAACRKHFFVRLMDLSEAEQHYIQTSGLVNDQGEVRLTRARHIRYLREGLRYLAPGFVSLDASRPWLCYWILQSLDLLADQQHQPLNATILNHAVVTMSSCQNATGGFGGGPLQLSHSAPTYAAVLSILIAGTEAAYETIHRAALYRWFLSLKDECGGFRMHVDGEIDVRGTYTVISIASLLNMLTPQLTEGVADFLLRCQGYEGGFGGEPGNEAHGGYAFCAFAALVILGRHLDADLDALEVWLSQRQMKVEGGFQGRTNKLVDGCYSFWQAGTAVLVELVRLGQEEGAVGWTIDPNTGQRAPYKEQEREDHTLKDVEAEDAAGIVYEDVAIADEEKQRGWGYTTGLFINQKALQKYVLFCSQHVEGGGLRDKPGKPRDFYHTCYCLSGLSVAQWGTASCQAKKPQPLVHGDISNLLATTSPVYNIEHKKALKAIHHFARFSSNHEDLLQGK